MNAAASAPSFVILDDVEADRASLSRILLSLHPSASVRAAATWTRAREQMVESAPDILLLDFCLSDGEGLTVLHEVRDEWPRTRVVVITGAGSESVARQFLRAGAQDYLSKDDLTPLRLEHVVDQALEQLRLSDELRRAREAARGIRREATALLRTPGIPRDAVTRILEAARSVESPVGG